MDNMWFSILLVAIGLLFGLILAYIVNSLRVTKASKEAEKLIAQAKKLKVDKFIKESKVINKVSEWVAKAPSSLKSLGKVILGWSPLMLAFTSIAHTSSHERAKATQSINNYTQLKEAQSEVRTAFALMNGAEAE